MCNPATIGLVLAATGTGVQAVNTSRTLKRQDNEAAAGIRKNTENQRKANMEVNKQIQDIDENTGEAERAQALTEFQTALRNSRPETEGALDPVLAANPRFAQSTSQGASTLRGEGDAAARRASIIDGILRQRMNEGQRINRTGSNLNAIRNDVAGEDFLTRLRIASKRNNPWLDAAGSLMQGMGSAYALKTPGVKPLTSSIPNIDAVLPVNNPSLFSSAVRHV